MTETALAALYRVVLARLKGTGGDPWGERVHPDVAPAGTARPHVVFGYAGGGELNENIQPDAGLVLTVQAICANDVDAFGCAARISALLNDADRGTARALDASPDWIIVHSLQEQVIHRVETTPEGDWIYYAGARYRFRMESVA